jgi:Protein of unknown function (DUF433)
MAVVVELWESGKREAFSKVACRRLFHNFYLDKNRQSLATYPDRTELKQEYPELEDEDIRQALAFAAA